MADDNALTGVMLHASVLDHLAGDAVCRPGISETLRASLEAWLTTALQDQGHALIAELVRAIGSLDVVAERDLPLRALGERIAQAAASDDSERQAALDAAVASLPRDTIGDLLQLDLPIDQHPLFQDAARRASLAAILSTSPTLSADPELHDEFLAAYADHDGPTAHFWDDLTRQPRFAAPGLANEIQLTLQLGRLTRENAGLVQTIRDERAPGSLRELANLDLPDWIDLVNRGRQSGAVVIPASIPGVSDVERAESYARAIFDDLRAEHPTAYLARDLSQEPSIDLAALRKLMRLDPDADPVTQPAAIDWERLSAADRGRAQAAVKALQQEVALFPDFDYHAVLNEAVTSRKRRLRLTNPARRALAQFFASAPDLDLRTTHIDTYLQDQPPVASGAVGARGARADGDQVGPRLKRLQRVLQVAPSFDAVSTLLAAGLDSAQKVTDIPRDTFVRQFGDSLGGEAVAHEAHARAEFVSAAASQIFTQIAQAMSDVQPRALASVAAPTIGDFPNLATLFGQVNLCECSACHSVYSPAAYFVDLLQMLKSSTVNDQSPLTELLARRPDLEFIKLTCENTNTELPYLDLVNEVLESFVVLGRLDQTVAKDTGTSTSAELKAEPQFTNAAAYDRLKQAVFPSVLPYDQPLDLARSYLDHLGSSRYQLMQTFRTNNVPSDLDLACEYLGISAAERAILVGAGAQVTADFYFDAASRPADLIAALRPARAFLDQADISYLDLIELLKTRFVNPNLATNPTQAMTLEAPADADPCDLDQVTIENLDDAALRRIHRFVRLWHKLGVSMQEIDKLLSGVGAADITDGFLLHLANVRRLQVELRLPPVQLTSLWSNIDTRGDDSLYRQLFLNRAVLNPANPSDPGNAFLPDANGAVLTDATRTVTRFAAPLLAALQVNAADLAMIRADAGLAADTAQLNLANVSALYRYVLLARALGLPVKDLIALKGLAGPDLNPFAPNAPDRTVQFVTLARKVQRSRFSAAALNYVYRHLAEPASAVPLKLADVLQIVADLRDGLLRLAATYAVVDDPTGEITRTRLGDLLDSVVVDQTMRLLDGSAVFVAPFASPSPIVFPAGLDGRMAYDDGAKLLRVAGPLSTADRANLLANVMPVALRTDAVFQTAVTNLFQEPRTFIASRLSTFLSAADAQAKLLDNQPLTSGGQPLTTAGKIRYVQERLFSRLRTDNGTALVRETLGSALGLDMPMLDLLLQRLNNRQAITTGLVLTSGGLTGTYCSDPDLQTVVSTRTDGSVAFAGTIPAGTGSVRWTGKIRAPANGNLTFSIRSNGAARLWIGENPEPVIAVAANAAAPETLSAPTGLRGGALYDLRLEARHLPAGGIAELRWSADGMAKVFVPASACFPSSIVDPFIRALTLLHKVSVIVSGLKLTVPELTYLLDHAADFDALDLVGLALDRTQPAQVDQKAVLHFRQWGRLADFVALRNSLPPSTVSLVDVFAAAAAAASLPAQDARRPRAELDVRNRLIAATGWDAVAVDALRGASGFNLKADAFRNEIAPLRLQAALRLVTQLGVPADQLVRWATMAPDAAQVQDIRQTVKARYDVPTWLTVARPLNDGLRERQRDALVAYLLPRLDLRESSQLFERFLIDVDMSACLPTSRIRQAVASVQLFVQRCLMNLEPSVSPLAINTERWQWMKQYRTWEANRKVFLYPENWIEPELRPDRSAFFKELQTELLQAELTPEAAETAFLHYLEKLDQVARLDICGMYWQFETDATGAQIDILHVFGRTLAVPQIYYYRQLRNRVLWTPWERVNLDITGDHLIPAIFNRRLYLFWPVFTPKTEPLPTEADGKLKLEAREKPQPKYWEIALAWSEYKQGKWVAKQVSTGASGVLSTNVAGTYIVLSDDADRHQYAFRTQISESGQSLTLECFRAGAVSAPGTMGQETQQVKSAGKFVLSASGGVTAFTESTAAQSWQILPGSAIDGLTLAQRDKRITALRFNSVGETRPVRILSQIPAAYRVLYPHQHGSRSFTLQVDAPAKFQPSFFQDDRRCYFIMPELVQETVGTRAETRFSPHYHPQTWRFIAQLNTRGLPGLLSLENQRPNDKGFVFATTYGEQFAPNSPTSVRLPYRVLLPYPEESVDFSYGGAYASYNWELFFHAPMLIASHLSKNHQWAQAQRWLHFIFDPTNPDPSGPPPGRSPAEWARERYWKVAPFQLYEWDQITALLAALSYTGTDPAQIAERARVAEQVRQWLADAFNPHLVARLRQVAYQKNVLMRYLDNLLGWADFLFGQYTSETIQEATQLYILAGNLLGPRPERIPPRGHVNAETYSSLKDKLDDFSNALVALENELPFSVATPPVNPGGTGPTSVLQVGRTAYFGIPQNDKLLAYWDTVADRLTKIRHCQTIEGVLQLPALFEPPIEPGLLVRARALGVDLASALSDVNAAVPFYRFPYMLQKTHELCNDLKSLGSALLAALEKRDAEALSLLRSTQELSVLAAARLVKERQIAEAEQTLEGFNKSRLVTQARLDYYRNIPNRIDYENEQVEQLGIAQDFQVAAQVTDIAATVSHLIPDFDAGVSGAFGTPVAKLRYGGTNIGNSLQAASRVLSFISSLHAHQANMAAIQGGWKRRADEWQFQAELAQKELDQIDKQIVAAQIRLDVAKQEMSNHDLQIEHARSVDLYLRDKFTNQELYDWMVGQVSAVYFQTYRMAYDLAKRTEKAFRFERGLTSSSFIQFGYWDNLKRGLVAGEQLSLALRQMEQAYLDQNRREYEITKHVSLLLHDPLALIALKETGRCYVSLPEALFDADYPGQYMRRIRSVSLTIPAVVGPYTSINCTLTLLSNKTRISSNAQGEYRERDDDTRFVSNFAAVQSIATSHAQNDSGLFELNFRDERYLPFEGAGAISEWRIDLPPECNAFDLDTISDVIIRLNYTAREGGELLRKAAWSAATLPGPRAQPAADRLGPLPAQSDLTRLYSARHEFPSEWHRFLRPPETAAAQTLSFVLTRERFPFQLRGKNLRIRQVELFLRFAADEATRTYREQGTPLAVSLTSPGGAGANGSLTSLPSFLNGVPHAAIDVGEAGLGNWTLVTSDADIGRIATDLRETVTANGESHQRLRADLVEDLVVVCHFSADDA